MVKDIKSNHLSNKKIGNRIRMAREEAHMNKRELAAAIHVASSTIVRYEEGTIENVKIPVIQAIATVLNVNPLWILGKEEEKELQTKVLKMQYYKFALKLQENNISEKDLELLWDFCELIAKHNST